jgi:outer membrane protein assembly factor BamB
VNSGGNESLFLALDLKTGAPLWQLGPFDEWGYGYSNPGTPSWHSTPALADGLVLVQDYQGVAAWGTAPDDEITPSEQPQIAPVLGIWRGETVVHLGATRDGCITARGPRRRPTVRWRTRGINDGGGPSRRWGGGRDHPDGGGGRPLIAGDLVFAGGWGTWSQGGLSFSAVTLDRGEKVWERKVARELDWPQLYSWPVGSGAVIDDLLVVGSNIGVHAFQARTGQPRWIAKRNDLVGSAALFGELCILKTRAGVVAYSVNDGRQRWWHAFGTNGQDDPFGGYGSPAVADGTLFVCDPKGLLALDPSNGKVKWTAPFPASSSGGDRYRGPLVTNGSVLCIGGEDHDLLLAFDAATGAMRWQTKRRRDERAWGRLAASGDQIVVGGAGLFGYELERGRRTWIQTLDGAATEDLNVASPVIADGVVYAVLREQEEPILVAADVRTGKLLWKFGTTDDVRPHSDTTPAIRDGLLVYQVTNHGGLCAIG